MKKRTGGASGAPPAAKQRKLAQCDVAQEHAADDVDILDALVGDLLLRILVAVVLHAQLVDLVGQSVERGHVFVGEGIADVPIFGACGGLVEEDLIVDDEASRFL